MNKFDFIKGVEKLIDPIEVGTLHFMQFFNNLLPKKIQKQFIALSAKKTPYMGFVVEPYSSFLCYEIADIDKAKSLIPNGFKLVKCQVFKDDTPKYYCVFGSISAHTSAFWGLRTEFYIMAEDIKTGLLSWLIIDYDSNTISYDKKNGLSNPNSSKSFITTDYDGNLYVDIKRNDQSRELSYNFNIEKGKMTELDQRFWLEGNLSIGYGKNISKTGDIFSLKFNPDEVKDALKIDDINIQVNNWFPGLFKDKPNRVVCFPYAQHFISDSPGHSSKLKTKADLEKAVEDLDFEKIEVFSTRIFKLMILGGGILSLLITITLLILLIWQ